MKIRNFEINLTYHYHLAEVLERPLRDDREKSLEWERTYYQDKELQFSDRTDISNTPLGSQFQNDFLKKIVVKHFHVEINRPDEKADNQTLKIAPGYTYDSGMIDPGLSGIEGTCWHNGFLSLTLRVSDHQKDRFIPSKDILDWVKHPEATAHNYTRSIIAFQDRYKKYDPQPDEDIDNLEKIQQEKRDKQEFEVEMRAVTSQFLGQLPAADLHNVDEDLKAGELFRMVNTILTKIEGELGAYLNECKLQVIDYELETPALSSHFSLSDMDSTPKYFTKFHLTDKMALTKLRSRPYVGFIFGDDGVDYEKIIPESESDKDRKAREKIQREEIERFCIAVGRTTPTFAEHFIEPGKYLAQGARNVYGDGGNIVFIGRRGWCAFEKTGVHKRLSFRMRVIETTHYVISLIDTGARARRWYANMLNYYGSLVFKVYHAALNKLLRTTWFADFKSQLRTISQPKGKRQKSMGSQVRSKLNDCTEFVSSARLISPCEDRTNLIEAHLLSHTARAAAARCKKLLDWDSLTSLSQELMGNYSAFLKTGADSMQMRQLGFAKTALVISVSGFLVTVFFGTLPKFFSNDSPTEIYSSFFEKLGGIVWKFLTLGSHQWH